MPLTPEQHAAFEEAKRGSVGQLLLKAARLVDERALAEIASTPDAPPMRPAHSRLLPHLDFDGVRATVLADRLGVTKQAIGPLVADLIAWGIVEQVPDPSDGRARLIRFTTNGLQDLHSGLAVLSTLEAELAAHIGAEKMDMLRGTLGEIIALLETNEQHTHCRG